MVDPRSPVHRTGLRRALRGRRRLLWATLAILAAGAIGVSAASVFLIYQANTSVSGATSILRFVNGGNYVSAHAEGFATNTYPNAAQVSVGVTMTGADGASSTYALDTLEVQAQAASAFAWHLRIDVSSALVATGVNAAYLFYCTAAPTGVSDTGAPLASGTDVNGNPWAIFAPTCAGGVTSLPLSVVGTGATANFATLAAAQTLLYISFGVAVTNTGATTTTAASLSLVANSP